MIQQTLHELGLTTYEAKTYLALLDLGEATSGEILSKASLHTGKIYEILESLKRKGLVSETKKNNVRHFQPADPRRIKGFLEEKKAQIDEQAAELDKVLPQLLARVARNKDETRIQVYTGYDGYVTAFSKEFERYEKNAELLVMGIHDEERYDPRLFRPFYNKAYPLREKIGVKARKIFAENARKDLVKQEKGSKTRFLETTSMTSTTILADLVIIGIYEPEVIVITIESQAVASSFKQQFEALWMAAMN